jgi:hypothetical protein
MRGIARRHHDTVWNSTVTSISSMQAGVFPAIGRSVRNRDIGGVRSNRVVCS